MTEKPLPITDKITKIIKDGDKLVRDVRRGIGQLIAGVNDLRELMGKSKGEHEK